MPQLTFTEEIVLLALDDKTGAQLPLPVTALGYGLAGAVLADLAMAGKVDTDAQQLTVLDPSPTGDPLLDPWLALITAERNPRSVAYWLSVLADRQQEIEQPALDRLIARGILKRQDKKILWVIGLRRYPTVDGHERTEVRTRPAPGHVGQNGSGRPRSVSGHHRSHRRAFRRDECLGAAHVKSAEAPAGEDGGRG